MSILTADTLHKTSHRSNPKEIAATVPPFPVIESPELKAQLSSEQYAAVQSYRDTLITTALTEKIDVAEIMIANADQLRGTDEIVFTIYVIAEAEAVMTLWERFDVAHDDWMQTQPEILKEFIYEHIATSVRRKRFPV